jgi:hypothetical protein
VAEAVAVLAGLTALLGAVGAVIVQLRRLEIRVDGRLTELLELTRTAAMAEGVKQQLEQTSGAHSEMLSGHSLPLART